MMIPEEKKPGYITLKEAGERFGYSQDYLGQLIRKGKLEGKLVYSHVAWVTTPEAVEEYIAEGKKKKQSADKEKNAEQELSEDVVIDHEVARSEYATPVIHQNTPVASSYTAKFLFFSYRTLLLFVAVFGVFVFYILMTAFGSEFSSRTAVASASVVFSTSQEHE